MLYILKATKKSTPATAKFIWFNQVEEIIDPIERGDYSFFGFAEDEESAWHKVYGVESQIPRHIKNRIIVLSPNDLIDQNTLKSAAQYFF